MAALVCAYVLAAIPAALLAGTLQVLLLTIRYDQPTHYLVYGIAANTAIALVPGLAFLPILAAVRAAVPSVRRLDPTAVGALGALTAVLVGFALLANPVGFWAPVQLVPMLKEDAFWGASLLVAAAVGWRLVAGRPFRTFVARSLLATAALVAAVAGLWVYSIVANGEPAAARLAFAPSAKARPNVFVILVDTLRADHLGVYGYGLPTSPHVDAFARDAVTYTRAFSQAPWTRPSCAALLTSMYAPDMHMKGLFDSLPPEVPILPQFLSAEGYATAGIVSSVQLSRVFGFGKGFDVLDIGHTKYYWAGLTVPLVRLGLERRSDSYPRYDAEQLVDRTVRWIRGARPTGKPLFMYLHFSDPHAPYRPPEGHDRWREFARGDALSIDPPPDTPPRNGEVFSPAQVGALVAHYDAEIAYFDEAFGRFVRYLKDSGLYDESLVVLIADHGEEFGEHGSWEHGKTVYNELLHVPLIVKYPEGTGPSPGSRVDRFVAAVDVAPTIEGLLGASWPTSAWRGQSLLDGGKRRMIYSDNGHPPLRAVFAEPVKLIQRLNAGNEVVDEKVFSLDVDFHELGDGSAPAGGAVADLAAMRSLMARIDAARGRRTVVNVSPDVRNELKGLGYVE